MPTSIRQNHSTKYLRQHEKLIPKFSVNEFQHTQTFPVTQRLIILPAVVVQLFQDQFNSSKLSNQRRSNLFCDNKNNNDFKNKLDKMKSIQAFDFKSVVLNDPICDNVPFSHDQSKLYFQDGDLAKLTHQERIHDELPSLIFKVLFVVCVIFQSRQHFIFLPLVLALPSTAPYAAFRLQRLLMIRKQICLL